MDENTTLNNLTVGELKMIIVDMLSTTLKEDRVYEGIKGIAEIFGCSESTAKRIKMSGAIDDAISQYGRTIVTDKYKALKLINHGRKRKTMRSSKECKCTSSIR